MTKDRCNADDLLERSGGLLVPGSLQEMKVLHATRYHSTPASWSGAMLAFSSA